jgi:hypothetical protein
VADRELETLRDSLREHVNALAVDIGPRTPLQLDSLVHAANYIYSVFEETASHAIECIPKLEHALPILASANGKRRDNWIPTASRSRLQPKADIDTRSPPNAHAKSERFTDTPGMLFGIFFLL